MVKRSEILAQNRNECSKRISVSAIMCISILGLFCFSSIQQIHADNSSLQLDPAKMQWWKNGKFGMFLCMGPSCLIGDKDEMGWGRMGMHPFGRPGSIPVEIYDNLYKKWNPQQFDADQWVQFAIDSGAKYIIFLTKHHDGFCLFNTKLTHYKSTALDSARRVDYLQEMADACHRKNFKLFVYYSQPDWHHPDYRTENHDRYIEYLHGQIREVLTNYGRIDGIWFDGLEGDPQDWQAEKLFRMARSLQPHLIINDRCGLPGDFGTAENRIGKPRTDRLWESCVKLGTRWIWRPEDEIKSLRDCIHLLTRAVGSGGNLALNTSPMPSGKIDPEHKKRFLQIGKWLDQYGESIYKTNPGPFMPAGWGASTYRDNKIYIHILNWRQKKLILPGIDRKIVNSYLLTGGSVIVRNGPDAMEIEVSENDKNQMDTIVVLELDAMAEKITSFQYTPGLYSMKASASSVHSRIVNDEIAWAPYKAFDDSTGAHSYWKPQEGVTQAWLELDMMQETELDKVFIRETPKSNIQAFEIQIKNGNQWQQIVQITKAGIGDGMELTFPPVKSRYVRLNILESDSPEIYEFQLFKR